MSRTESVVAVELLGELDHFLETVTEEQEVQSKPVELGAACPECRATHTPLITAITAGHHHCLEEMLTVNKGLLAERAQNDATAAHIAARRGDLESLRLVLAADPGLCNVGDVRGATPLHVCAHHGSVECVECLLDSQGSAHHTDSDGATPVHFAAAAGHLHCLKVLIDKGRGDCNSQTHSGETPGAVV